MLSPKKPRILLLPDEQRMIDMLGMSPAEYRWYCREAQKIIRFKDGEPVAFFGGFGLALLIVGIALNYASVLLSPRQQGQSDPARLEPRRVDGQDIVNASRFTSRSSFSGIQNVVELNSPIPIVYANRENKPADGLWYGGVRVNTNLVWSQLWSVGGSQLFRAIFLVSESSVAIDPFQTAMGDNLFGSYDLKPTDSSNKQGRVSFYFRPGGGAIVGTDYVAGRHYTHDTGNSSGGGGEVFLTYDIFSNTNVRKFSYTYKPQTQTQFGLYGPIAAGLAYRTNPRFSPAVTPSLLPRDTDPPDGSSIVACSYDTQRICERDVQGSLFNGRTTLASITNPGDESIAVGDELRVVIDASTDFGGTHTVPAPAGGVIGGEGEVRFDAAAQAVAGRQRSYDENLIEGELYKIGECIGVCIERTDAPFVSLAEGGGGQTVQGDFRITEGGQIREWLELENFPGQPTIDDGSGLNGTQGSHIFRCAISSFTVDRPCKQLEIGFRSTLGIRYNGMVDWSSVKPYQTTVPNGTPDDNVDWLACFKYDGQTINKGEIFAPQQYNSGTYTGVDLRYSFFSIEYRIASNASGDIGSWTRIRRTFGTRSSTGEPTFNYLTLGMPSEERWEFRIVPITGWQIRYQHGVDELCILDAKLATVHRYQVPDNPGLWIRFNGEDNKINSPSTFMLKPTVAADVGIKRHDDEGDYKGYVDAYGKVAELFWYEEIQSTVGGSPEHEVSYVNIIQENPPEAPGGPSWENMSLLGMNLRASTESNELGQISVYCTQGVETTPGGSNRHLFPNVLRDLFLNARYGAGEVMSAELIDEPSFQAAAAWTDKQRYFFDAGLSQVLNLVNQGNEWAQYFLLDLGKSGGKFTLNPIANFADDGAHPIEAMFTSGNIISTEVTSAEQQDRVPPIVVVKWRFEQQVQNEDLTGDDGTGIFPVIRSVVVREASTPADAPIIEADLTQFCTSEYQAIDYAKMTCRQARLQDYGVTIKTFPDVAAASPGAVIKVSSETVVYTQPSNGVILNDGSINGFPTALDDGDYDVVIWDGQGQSVQETTLTVADGKAQGWTNAVFTLASPSVFADTFKVRAVDYDEDGNVDIQAIVFPLDINGFSELTKNWEDSASWVIEGAGAFPARPEPEPVFSGVSINGPSTGFRQTGYLFTATPFGPSTSTYSYAWSTSHGVISGSGSSVTLTVDENVTATITCDVTEQETGTTLQGSAQITIGEEPLIGIIVNGAVKPAINQSYLYSITIDGPTYSDYVYSWSTTIGTINGNTADPTVLVDFAAGELGQTGVIRCELTQTFTGITKGFSLSVLVVQELALDIVGPTSVGINIPYGYFADLQGADPNTTTWFWEEI